MTDTEQPVPRSLNDAPARSGARAIEPAVLQGRWSRLEPIDPPRHGAALFAASHAAGAGPELWDYMGYGPFANSGEMHAWLEGCAASRDPLFLAILDERGEPAGMASFMRIVPAHGVVEIGNIWMAPSLQRTRAASEAMYLMMRHAFDGLGYRRLEWKCNALNEASRRAARRLGFAFEGIFYRHMIVKGRNRDTAWYAMLDTDWPRIDSGFRSWLAPENFDGTGKQIRLLGDFNAPV